MNPDGGGNSGGAGAGADGPLELPYKWGNEAACVFSETLCHNAAKDWAAAQIKYNTVNKVMRCQEDNASSSETTEEDSSRETHLRK